MREPRLATGLPLCETTKTVRGESEGRMTWEDSLRPVQWVLLFICERKAPAVMIATIKTYPWDCDNSVAVKDDEPQCID